MNDFRPLDRHDLDRLDDEELVAYIREANRRGHRPARDAGFEVLIFRHERNVTLRVRAKVPENEVKDVVQEAFFSLSRAILEEREIRIVKAFLHTIVSRRIADATGKRASRPPAERLAEEHGGDEEGWGEVVSVEDETEALGVRRVIDQVYAELNAVHAAVVDLYVFEDRAAHETAAEVNQRFAGDPDLTTPMTNDNVHQIAKRFRDRVRELLAAAGD